MCALRPCAHSCYDLGEVQLLSSWKGKLFNSSHQHALTLRTAPLSVEWVNGLKRKRHSFFGSSEDVICLNLVTPQSQHLNLVPNPISRVVMFVGACVVDSVPIKTSKLIFKSINIHKKQKSHWMSTSKGQRIKKKKLPIQSPSRRWPFFIGLITRKYKRASFY